jgi:hypothetical protein
MRHIRTTGLRVLGGALLLALALFVVVALYKANNESWMVGQNASSTVTVPVGVTVTPTAPVRKVAAGQREYRSAQYHFSVLYPQELTVKEYQENGGAMTIAFENDKNIQGFQIYIAPYTEPQVSESQFKKDDPSGVRDQLTSIKVGGATGATFYSMDAALGATREVWFVHGGYLYEVTTLKPLDTWLTSLIQAWQFI